MMELPNVHVCMCNFLCFIISNDSGYSHPISLAVYSHSMSSMKTSQLLPLSSTQDSLLPANIETDKRKDPPMTDTSGGSSVGGVSLCSWPPRNSQVFAPLNAIMERCNDLLDLVQTVHDFRSAWQVIYI